MVLGGIYIGLLIYLQQGSKSVRNTWHYSLKWNCFQVLEKDVDKLVELSAPWAAYHLIQGTKYFKIERQGIDINEVVAGLEQKLKEELQ